MRVEPDSRRAWVTALLSFVAMFVSIGTGFSYGVLVLPASRDLGVAEGTVAGAFAVTVMVFFLMGAPAGVLADRVGARVVLALGALAMGCGLLVTATAPNAAMLYLGHGLLVGLAMSSTFIPLTAAVSAVFERRRSTAVGVAVSGIGLGTLVMAPLLAALIRAVGWRDSYLVLAAGSTAVLLVCAALTKGPRLHSPHAPPASESTRTRDYRLMYASQVLLSVAIFTPFAHLPAYAEQSGADAVDAAALVGVIGAASVVGRLGLGWVADRWGLFRTYRICFVAIGASFVAWLWPGAAYPALLLHAVVLGVGYGGFVALLPGLVAHRFGLERLGGLLGILYTSHVFGAGLGPLATGLLVDRLGYVPAGVTGLVCGLAAAVVLGGLSDRVSATPVTAGARAG
ncbi:MAG TPA: MFS transporter [Nocardioidaceae bacterium]|nr:MFS transporter [Nocardioidaceae bacterium]